VNAMNITLKLSEQQTRKIACIGRRIGSSKEEVVEALMGSYLRFDFNMYKTRPHEDFGEEPWSTLIEELAKVRNAKLQTGTPVSEVSEVKNLTVHYINNRPVSKREWEAFQKSKGA
jgi:hypothetical protein